MGLHREKYPAVVENNRASLPGRRTVCSRNYNIESLTVAPTEDPTLSRLTLTTSGDVNKISQIQQLDKLVEVVRVVDLCESPTLNANCC